MWKLLALAALIGAVTGQPGGGPPMAALEQNLTAVWERLHDLEDGGSCRPQITMHVHGPGRGGHREHHSHEDEDGDHEEGDHDGSHEHGHRGHHDDGSAHVHVHLHMDGRGAPPGRDIYHANPAPWASKTVEHNVYAVCHMHSGTHDITGAIHLKQNFIGGEATEMRFDLSGFNAEVHEHNFFVHRFGCLSNACANIGAVFTPPHRKPGGHGGHHASSEEEDEPEVGETGGSRKRRSHHGHEDGRTEGVIGPLACDENGEMHQEMESDALSLIGLHNVAGRTIAIHQADDTEGTEAPLACCVVGWNDGSFFGEEIVPWLPQEKAAAEAGEHPGAHEH